MKTITHEGQQGTDEWHEHRAEKITASPADLIMVNELKNGDIFKSAKSGKLGAGYKTYLDDKVNEALQLERISDNFTSKEMQWGIDNEPLARNEYERQNMVDVREVCFIEVEGLKIGISPDGLPVGLGKRGLEIKCFNSSNHLQIVKSGIVPSKVYAQCQFSMMVMGFEFWDTAFYDPRVIKPMSYKQIEVVRDEAYIEILKTKTLEGCAYIENELKRWRG